MVDRLAAEALLTRYLAACEARDVDIITSCFGQCDGQGDGQDLPVANLDF